MNTRMIKFTRLQIGELQTTKVEAGQALAVSRVRMQRNASSLMVFMLTAAVTISASSDLHGSPLSSINAYIGFAKTMKSAIGAFVGETTVTPACALGRWDHYDYGVYGQREDGKPNYFGQHLQVVRNPYTGQFFYSREFRDQKTGRWYEVDHDPIPIPSLSRVTWTCVPNPGAPFIYNTLEDFSIQVWAVSVKKKGYFPPKEPYTAYMRSDATSLQQNCDQVDFTSRQTKIRSAPIFLRDSGFATVKMPIVQYEYSFPPLLWVGDWKDY